MSSSWEMSKFLFHWHAGDDYPWRNYESIILNIFFPRSCHPFPSGWASRMRKFETRGCMAMSWLWRSLWSWTLVRSIGITSSTDEQHWQREALFIQESHEGLNMGFMQPSSLGVGLCATVSMMLQWEHWAARQVRCIDLNFARRMVRIDVSSTMRYVCSPDDTLACHLRM